MLSIVKRSGVDASCEKRFTRSRGRKRRLSYTALLVAILVAGYSRGRSYTRADVCAAIAGFSPEVARSLGVLDADGKWHVPRYKVVNRMIKRLERSLRWAWTHEDILHGLEWFAASLITASVPRKIRRSVKTIAIDGTPIEAWGCTKEFTKQKELEKDAYANWRKASLENPELPDPELKRELLAKEARRRGLKVGRDGRIIRGADEDARAGWMTATNSRSGKYFVGYELTAAVAVADLSWNGRNPYKFNFGPEVRPYILSISLNPAGTNPGPIGVETVRGARRAAPKINRVIADRGFTLKREKFLRELHKERIDVVMDYPQRMVEQADSVHLGERDESAYMHCGTLLSASMPKYWRTPPKELLDDEEKLIAWYTKRWTLWRLSFKGWLEGGGMKLQQPCCAGRISSQPATAASGSYDTPLVSAPSDGKCCEGQVNAHGPEVDHFQKVPYHTKVWHKVYGKNRAVVEGVFGDLKKKGGLSRGFCQALGLAANTIAATVAAVAHNVRQSAMPDPAGDNGSSSDDSEDDGEGTDLSSTFNDPIDGGDDPACDGKSPDRAPPS